MAIQYLDQSFLGLQEYIERKAEGRNAGTELAPPYAHPVDGWIIHTLNATPIKTVMNKAIDALVSYQFGHESPVRLTRRAYWLLELLVQLPQQGSTSFNFGARSVTPDPRSARPG
jgi:hypothetical protein